LPSTVTTAAEGLELALGLGAVLGGEVALREVLLDGPGGGLRVVHALAAPGDVPQLARGGAEAVRREEVADGVGEAAVAEGAHALLVELARRLEVGLGAPAGGAHVVHGGVARSRLDARCGSEEREHGEAHGATPGFLHG
jgi:hypothetical protein